MVRLWKDDDNTYHLKGMWVDDKWMLITGNNLNPRALLAGSGKRHFDPRSTTGLAPQREKELELIREHTTIVKHYRDLQSIADYPVKVQLIRRLRRIRIHRLISRIRNHNPVLYGVCFLEATFCVFFLSVRYCYFLDAAIWLTIAGAGRIKLNTLSPRRRFPPPEMNISQHQGMSRDYSAMFGLMFLSVWGRQRSFSDSRPQGGGWSWKDLALDVAGASTGYTVWQLTRH